MNTIILDKTYNVELLINRSSTTQTNYFPIIQVLDTKLTQGVSTYINEVIPVCPSNTPTANTALMKVSFLTLWVGDSNQLWNMPMLDFCTLNAQPFTGVASSPFAVEFNNLKIIWAKSYVFIADTSKVSTTQNEAFMFNIKYVDPPKATAQ